MASHSISEASTACLEAFQECLANTSLSRSDLQELQDQQARFNIWAANLAVFAKRYRASLDNRLRQSNDTRVMILELLLVLRINLDGKRTICVVESIMTMSLSSGENTEPFDRYEFECGERTRAGRYIEVSLWADTTPNPLPGRREEYKCDRVAC
jgi:hypothetical protein